MPTLKTKPFFLALIFLLPMTLGCKKLTLNEALPTVAIKSVTVISSDTTAVTGTIVSHGADIIEYEGLCYSNNPMPEMLDNQKFIQNSATDFTINIPLKQDSTYYIRVYATNSYGYSISLPYKITIPHARPAVAPCTLTPMQIVDQGNPYKIDFLYSGTGYAAGGAWGLEADLNGGSNRLLMDFNKIPTNGVYVTGGSNEKGVHAELDDDFNTNYMQPGDSVYVSENADKSLNISFCSLHYSIGATQVAVYGQLTTK